MLPCSVTYVHTKDIRGTWEVSSVRPMLCHTHTHKNTHLRIEESTQTPVPVQSDVEQATSLSVWFILTNATKKNQKANFEGKFKGAHYFLNMYILLH